METNATERWMRDKRWMEAVDFGSPMSSWSEAMWEEYRLSRKEDRFPDMNKVEKSS